MENHFTKRRAKIVATLGPASNDVETIKKLIRAGLNVARINMSHGTHEGHKEVIENVREASRQIGWEVAILLDLQGPKIRVDKLEKNLVLAEGEEWVIGETKLKDKYPEYQDKFIPTIYENLVKDSKVGDRILFDDGNLQAVATEHDREVLKIKVSVGGELKSNKGINLPDSNVSAPSFTEKDEKDLMFGLTQNIDFVALSFVRRKEDILKVKYLLHKLKVHTPIVAKIEKPQALDNIEGILDVTDGIMVARGDMGVEIGNHLVPRVQKELIDKCNNRGIPVITATQMMESMIENPVPTRAEASDVANAIWDGTDAVMLSAESAAGKYPVVAVEMMASIIKEAEKNPKERPYLRHVDLSSINASTMVAASLIAEKTGAKSILSVTETGNSLLKLSRFRPKNRVMGVTTSVETLRRMCLYWGVTPFLLKNYDADDEGLEFEIIKQVKEGISLVNGDKIVITRGDGKFFKRGSSNSLRVETIKDKPKVESGEEYLEHVEFDKGAINLSTITCAGCQSCVSICPHDIWAVRNDSNNHTYINESKVSECSLDMECVRVCPTGAIEIIPK